MQLYGQDYSGTAIVTSGGELLVTGSIQVTNDTADDKFDRSIQNQILTELKILNTHMELINNEKINEEDIRR